MADEAKFCKLFGGFFVAKNLAQKLINAGVHFGHGVSRWNPRMAPFIFAKRGNIHIISVKETLKGMLIAKKLLVELVSSGKDVVFVGTKRQAQKAVESAANRCGMHYVSQRWLGGMLTNFRTIRSRLQRLQQLEAMQEDGTLESQSKKQASRLKREMRKIAANLQGIRNMSRLPGAVVVVDVKKEYLALREARKLEIATVGLNCIVCLSSFHIQVVQKVVQKLLHFSPPWCAVYRLFRLVSTARNEFLFFGDRKHCQSEIAIYSKCPAIHVMNAGEI